MSNTNTQTNNDASTTTEEQSLLIFVKSHSVGEDSKGRQKFDLRLSEEETQQLISELGKIKSRAKIQVHIGETSAFMFVKEVQERGAAFGAKKTSGSVSTGNGGGYKPRTSGDDVKSKLAAMKKQA
jgi:hypothetical protein